MVQSCFTAWNWFQPSLVNLETEDSKPKVYSWDTKKIDLTQYSFENLQEQTVVKAPGSIEGEQFMVRNCINCNIYLLDHINTITIDDCKNCKIFIGPTKVKKSLKSFILLCVRAKSIHFQKYPQIQFWHFLAPEFKYFKTQFWLNLI